MAETDQMKLTENSSKTERILNGPMYKVLLMISFPLIVNNLIMTLYNMADAYFVGQLGTTEFAAVSFVNPVMFLFQAIGMGVQIAGTSIIAQLIGRNKEKEAREYAYHVLIFSTLIGVLLGVLGYIVSPYIVQFMGGEGRFGDLSNEYLKIIFLGVPFQILFMGVMAIMNAQGNTKSSTIVNSVAAVTNVILDPIFIFDRIPVLGFKGFGMGVRGAAAATSISQVVLLALGYYMMKKTTTAFSVYFRNIPLERKKLQRIVKVGLPSATGQSGAAFGFIILNTFIAAYGTSLLAAFALVNRVNNIIMMPAMGIGSGLTSIVGQNMGAKNPKRVREGFWKAVKLSLLISIIGSILLYLLRVELVYFFTPTAEPLMVSQSLEYLIYILPTIPLMGLFSIFQGLFQGAGHTNYSMFMAIGRLWLIRIPLILFFNNFTGLGQRGVWIAMNVSNILVVVYGYYIYRTNRWTKEVL
jgi:putative MATE family efflux protein